MAQPKPTAYAPRMFFLARWIRRTPGRLLALLLLLPLAAPGALRGAPQDEPTVNPDGFTSAEVCGTCHEDIHRSWKRSLHALSLEDPIFQSAYMQALMEFGDEAKRVCLRCHAPMTMANSDFELADPVTREGVGCDFCHTVKAVHLDDAERPYTLDPGLVKRSVLKDASSPAHEVAYSELHTRAEFCGGCHNLVAASGAAIMSTYQEWLDGPYASQGVVCQDCHMALRKGQVVRSGLGSSEREFHVHDLIRDSALLRSALTVRITRAERNGRDLVVDVELENVGSGHMLPTGIPSREIVLTVRAEAGDQEMEKTRHYRKVVADAQGRVLTLDHQILMRGARILNDNRIAPGEKRQERVSFAVPTSGVVRVSAAVSYLYSPRVLKQEEISVELGRAERVVR